MKRKKLSFMLCIVLCVMTVVSVSCSNNSNPQQNNDATVEKTDLSEMNFDEIAEKAKGTKVTFYGWGGDEYRNNWLNTDVASALKEKYDITLDVVPMDIDQILNKLSGEKQAGNTSGSIDVIWINGENFFTAKENSLLYGPFLDKLPSYEKYIDTEDPETNFDFGYPIEGYEAPYGKAQIVFMGDSAKTPETPADAEEFLKYAKKYKGKVTYPALPDFTGSAFARNVIYEICGYEQFMDMEADRETVREAVMPAMEYLKSLNPYLWNEGKTFPASSTEQENMFSDGELFFNLSYGPYSVATRIEDGVYPDTVRTYLFDKGTIGNTSYMAIANNSSNKEGAMVVIDYLMSAEGQAGQFDKLKELPVVDNNKLSPEEKDMFTKIDTGKGTLSQEELLSKRLPEMPANLVPIIEEIWLEEVVGK